MKVFIIVIGVAILAVLLILVLQVSGLVDLELLVRGHTNVLDCVDYYFEKYTNEGRDRAKYWALDKCLEIYE